MGINRIDRGVRALAVAKLLEETLMAIISLVEMSDDEFTRYKQETLKRMCQIAEADGHAYVAYITKDGWGEMVDLDTGKPIYSMGGGKD